tara:strand:+ start:386 stop:859 length:474 start_codon:yes stop_codon:yes gene_type:complete
MKIISVTGSAGAGKTAYAKQLVKQKKYVYFDVGDFIRRKKLYDGYDRSLRTYVVDEKKIVKVLRKIVLDFKKAGEKGVVLDGHLSHYLSKNVLDFVVVVKCDVKTLRRRLEKRGYVKKKIEENIEAEIMETCLVEAKELGHKVKVVEGKRINKLKVL